MQNTTEATAPTHIDQNLRPYEHGEFTSWSVPASFETYSIVQVVGEHEYHYGAAHVYDDGELTIIVRPGNRERYDASGFYLSVESEASKPGQRFPMVEGALHEASIIVLQHESRARRREAMTRYMARIPRLYRVRARHSDGTLETRHYQTPEAAREREQRFLQEDADATVTIEKSHPVIYPRNGGEAATFEIPDSLIRRSEVAEIADLLGIRPDALLHITVTAQELLVEYEGDPAHPGRHAPKLLRVYIEED